MSFICGRGEPIVRMVDTSIYREKIAKKGNFRNIQLQIKRFNLDTLHLCGVGTQTRACRACKAAKRLRQREYSNVVDFIVNNWKAIYTYRSNFRKWMIWFRGLLPKLDDFDSNANWNSNRIKSMEHTPWQWYYFLIANGYQSHQWFWTLQWNYTVCISPDDRYVGWKWENRSEQNQRQTEEEQTAEGYFNICS